MKFLKLNLIFFLACMCNVNGKMITVFDSKLDGCLQDGEEYVMFDFSNLGLVPENDTLTWINGTWKFLREVNRPWFTEVQLQKYDRGEWLMQAKKTYIDLCNSIHNSMEPGYFITRYIPKCPIKPGQEAIFDMVPGTPSEFTLSTFPPSFAGRWRVQLYGEFFIDGKKFKDCRRFYLDMYEV